MKNEYRNGLIEKIGVLVKQGEVMVDSVKTAYLTAGTGDTVILLHGAGAGAVTWYPTIGAISKSFHVIAPDIVGYGESDKPIAPYDRPYFCEWLNGFLIAMNITKAHIVGLSQGGAIALQFAIDYPEKVDKLVLVDAAGLGAKVSFWPLFGMVWMNSFPGDAASRFNAPYLMEDPKKRDPNHSHYSVSVLKYSGGKNAFRQGKGAAVSEIPKQELRQIKNETLIIWGKDDRLFSVEYGERAAEKIPNARFHLIRDAGHLPHMDQPHIFNEILTNFLQVSAIASNC